MISIIQSNRFGGWTPLSLSPALWLDASDASTITESGGAVSAWADKSSNEYIFAQADAGFRPSTGAAMQNGLNVISFSGVSTTIDCDWLQEGAASNWTFMHDGTNHLVALVVKSLSNQQIYMGNGQGNGERGLMFYAYTSTGTWLYLPYSSNQAPTSGGTSPQILMFLTDPDNAIAGERSAIYKNGGVATKNNVITTTPSLSAPQYKWTIGAAPYNSTTVSYGLTGWIAEVVIVAGSEADDESRLLLRDYLNNKWAIY